MAFVLMFACLVIDFTCYIVGKSEPTTDGIAVRQIPKPTEPQPQNRAASGKQAKAENGNQSKLPSPLHTFFTEAATAIDAWRREGAIKDAFLGHVRSVMSNLTASLLAFVILAFFEKPIVSAYNRHLENNELRRLIANWRAGASSQKPKMVEIVAKDHTDINVAGIAFDGEDIPEVNLRGLRLWRPRTPVAKIANCDFRNGKIENCKFGSPDEGAEFENTHFKAVRHLGVDYSGCTFKDGGTGKVIFDQKCTFKNVLFMESKFAGDLPDAEISKTHLWGAHFAQGIKVKAALIEELDAIGILRVAEAGATVMRLGDIALLWLSQMPILRRWFPLPPLLQGAKVQWKLLINYARRLDWLGFAMLRMRG